MKVFALTLVALAAASPLAAGQSAADQATHMVRAAGMPLNDGTLAPGILTVRLVEGAFTRNLAGETVTLEVVGGTRETATTGSDGRAQFAHVPIGASVRVSATVAGEPLSSDLFPIPSQSGVRVLLVAGGDGAAGASPHATGTAPAFPLVEASTAVTASPAFPPPPGRDEDSSVLVIRTALVSATVTALGFVLFGRRPRR